MDEEQISQIVELYGLDRILEDNHIELPFLLAIAEELGYINLEGYHTGDNHADD